MVLSLVLGLVLSGRAAPANPLLAVTADQIEPETLSGTYGGLTMAEQAELELEREEEDQEQPEQQEEPEPEQEPENQPEGPEPGTETLPDPEGEDADGNGEGEGDDPSHTPAPTEPYIDTNLASGTVYQSDLSNHTLSFYAKAVNAGDNAFVRVRVRNDETGGVYKNVGADGDENFTRKLAFGQNYFMLYLIQDGKTVQTVNITIRYEAMEADADNPDQGEHPLTVVTNLDGAKAGSGNYHEERNDVFTFVVTVTDHNGSAIQHDHMTVTLIDQETGTSKMIRDYTGKNTYEYELQFTPPNIGEYKEYRVALRAWDDDGNSAYREYVVRYYAISEGDVIGTATVIIDATSVGLGVVDVIGNVEIKSGDTAADVIVAALNSYDYVTSPATVTGNQFYLSSISRSGTFGGSIPAQLKTILQNDNVVVHGAMSYDSLGDTHYTNGSGWMCWINGSNIGRSMGSYPVSAGCTIELRYTVAWGKDVGGSGGSGGLFPQYCYTWVGGSMVERGHDYVEEIIEPTETEDGEKIQRCRRCEKEIITVLPATGGGTEEPDPPVDPDAPDTPDTPQPTMVAVPRVTGQAEAAAIGALQGAQLSYAVNHSYDAAVPAGVVISQSVTAGTQVAAGTVVTLTVSLGPEPAPEPDPVPTPDPTPTPDPAPVAPVIDEPETASTLLYTILAGEMRTYLYETTKMALYRSYSDIVPYLAGVPGWGGLFG